MWSYKEYAERLLRFSGQFDSRLYGLLFFPGKVLFDFHAPAVDEDRRTIISYQEFYEIVRRYCAEYANQHLEEKEEIMHLLEQLKKRLDSASTTDLKVCHRRT